MFAATLLLLLVATSLFVGFISRHPALNERSLILDPTKRGTWWAVYLMSGVSRITVQCAERLVYISSRYGASRYDLHNLSRLLAIAPLVVAAALHIGWVAFDLHSIGDWSFFPKDSLVEERVGRSAVYFAAIAWMCFAFAIRPRLDSFTRRRFGTSGDLFFNLMAFAAGLPAALLGQNNGLLVFLAFPVLVANRGRGWLLAFSYAFVLYVMREKMGSLQTLITLFSLISGLLAWFCMRVVVELIAAANWHDASNGRVLIFFMISALFAFASVLAVPTLTMLTMTALDPILPQKLSSGWQDHVAVFREGGRHMAIILALAAGTPFLPVACVLIYGLGSGIGNAQPAAKRFMEKMKTTPGQLTRAEYLALTADRRTAYFVGYAAATALTLTIVLAALLLASVLIYRQF